MNSLSADTPTGCIWVGTNNGNIIMKTICIKSSATNCKRQPWTIELMHDGNKFYVYICMYVQLYVPTYTCTEICYCAVLFSTQALLIGCTILQSACHSLIMLVTSSVHLHNNTLVNHQSVVLSHHITLKTLVHIHICIHMHICTAVITH